MSRSGYSEDVETWDMIKWRGQVASATRGKRDQKLFADLLAALDAMPEKSLIAEELETEDGEVCALGALGKHRGIKIDNLDPEDPDQVAQVFDVAPQLAREIVYMNDEWGHANPAQRWERMRAWVASQIRSANASTSASEIAQENAKTKSSKDSSV